MRRALSAPEKADIEAAEDAASLRHSAPIKAMGVLSELADQPQMISICSGVLVFGLLARNRRRALAGARMLAAELLATKLKSIIKHRVDRTRPEVIADGGDYDMERGSSRATERNSFPSGHTAGAVAVARALARSYPEHRLPGYVAAAGVAAIQVPRAKHFVSDLMVGAMLGFAADAALGWAERGLRRAVVRAGARERE